jgi:hypothetical protein
LAGQETEVFSFRVTQDVMADVRALAGHLGVSNAAVVNVLLRVGLRTYGADVLAATARPRRGEPS